MREPSSDGMSLRYRDCVKREEAEEEEENEVTV